ncbi:MAG: hypothetical protein C0606_18150 [Hyphomicrobiales bacterium]|nr:MAG: hypothetical protein C0606_18150 [Hyphomicrobiales bacterium]
MMPDAPTPYVLQVCRGCQLPAHEGTDRSPTDGERVIALCRRLLDENEFGVAFVIREYPCLGGCNRRCRLSFGGPGMWSWLIGDIDPEKDGPFIVETLRAWLAAENGLIPKPERSKRLVAKALGRVPPL